MADNTKPLSDFAQPSLAGLSGIKAPTVDANNFEIKPATISLFSNNAFHGLPNEDPYDHLDNFNRICETFKMNGVTEDAIKLRCFGFSLQGRAKEWLKSLSGTDNTTWAQVSLNFLSKHYPPSKTARMVSEISNFYQDEQESLYEAWERFKELLRKCPHHGIEKQHLMLNFYRGLLQSSRSSLDASAGGGLMSKNCDEAWKLVEQMASNNFFWANERGNPRKASSVNQVDTVASLTTMMSEMQAQQAQDRQVMIQLMSQIAKGNSVNVSAVKLVCDLCGGGHTAEGCPFTQRNEQVNFVRNNQYGNTYNPNFRHPNLSWSNNQNVLNPPMNQAPKEPSRLSVLEAAMLDLTKKHGSLVEDVRTGFGNQAAAIKNLETQIGQLAAQLRERPAGTFPSNTENTRECNAVTTRSGRELSEKSENQTRHSTGESQANPSSRLASPVPQEIALEILKPADAIPRSVPAAPAVPFPQQMQKNKVDKQFLKFFNVFKKLHINIPLIDAIAEIPSYAKFMKKVLANKKKLEEYETLALSEECSAVLLKKLPPKLKDPGSFSIPCAIGPSTFERALCDLGSSINLMPLSVFKRLGLGEPKPTTVSLQLADRSIKHPRGVVEDVLVRVGELILPADFIILDMEEDKNIPIILGRPFLATGRATIYLESGELSLKVEDQEETFKVFKSLKPNDPPDSCYRIDAMVTSEDFSERCKGRKHKKKNVVSKDGDKILHDPH